MPWRAFAEEATRIIVKLDDLLYAPRMKLTELAERVAITLADRAILKTGNPMAVRRSTLAVICRELDCRPGDLPGHNRKA